MAEKTMFWPGVVPLIKSNKHKKLPAAYMAGSLTRTIYSITPILRLGARTVNALFFNYYLALTVRMG